MDDTDKTQGQTQNPQQPQAGGVGTLVKERELPVASSAGPSVSEFVGPSGSEAEHKIDRELEEIGVERVSETPQLDSHAQKAGVSPAGESVPVKTAPSGLAQIPKTEEEAKQELKHENPTNSNWGRLMVFVKFFRTIHNKLLTSKG